jgi:hypothetical protein
MILELGHVGESSRKTWKNVMLEDGENQFDRSWEK